MQPVQPGWVAIEANVSSNPEWFHIVGWTRHAGQPHPVIATAKGVSPWFITFGEDPYCVATLKEWRGE